MSSAEPGPQRERLTQEVINERVDVAVEVETVEKIDVLEEHNATIAVQRDAISWPACVGGDLLSERRCDKEIRSNVEGIGRLLLDDQLTVARREAIAYPALVTKVLAVTFLTPEHALSDLAKYDTAPPRRAQRRTLLSRVRNARLDARRLSDPTLGRTNALRSNKLFSSYLPLAPLCTFLICVCYAIDSRA